MVSSDYEDEDENQSDYKITEKKKNYLKLINLLLAYLGSIVI